MILVSACRTGKCCRYHGRVVESPSLMRALAREDYQIVCPEMEAGLPCPRPPIRVHGKRLDYGGKDIAPQIEATCKKLAEETEALYFIGTSGSPTCDPETGAFSRALAKAGVPTYLSVRRGSASLPRLPGL